MANIVIKPASGTLEFNTGVVAGSAVDTTLSGASRLTFDSGELNLVSYATGNLNRFTIDGSTSRLFSAYDQMSGSLMSINTIAGFPVFEAFSDNTIVLGKYGSKDFVSTGNKIGIGTAAPANKLEVFGTGDVSVRITTTGSAAATDFAALRFFQGGAQKGSVIANSGVLRIGAGDGVGASSGVYVNSAGNVGIGTTDPSGKLSVMGPVSFGTNFETVIGSSGLNNSAQRVNLYYNGTLTRYNIVGIANVSLGLGTNGVADKVVIDTNGNVGIGLTTPSAKLEISGGSIQIDNNQSIKSRLVGGGLVTLLTYTTANQTRVGANTEIEMAGYIAFRPTGIENMRIDSSGNVGIGTTAPMAKLQVSGSILPVGHLAAGQDLGGQSNYWNTLYSNTANFYQNVNIDIGDFIVGTSDFVVRNAAGNVGIGTAAPTGKLEVFGTGDVGVRITTSGDNATTDFAALRFFQGGAQKGSVIANSGVLRIGAGDGIGANSGVYVNSAGSVGIGISPAYPLQIRKSGGGGSLAISVNNVMSQYGRDSLYLAIADDTAYVAGHAWYVRNATATDNFAMGINNLGNVGIGTDRPTGKLEVFGTGDVSVRITTTGNNATTDFAALRFFQGGVQKGSIIANNSVLRLSAGTNLSGIFISASGNVGINSIPTGTNNVRFQVNGGVASNVAALRFENCGLVLGGNLSDKAFSSWLPIQIDSSTTRYIPLYA